MANYYNDNAQKLFDKYQGVNPDIIHASWLKWLPSKPALALDVGGGSGRDAKWLAQKGWEVVVVEPASEFAKLGRNQTDGFSVTWVDDSLPALVKLKEYRTRFSLILISGVLMHLSQDERIDSLQTLENLMAEKSLLVITLRHGPDSEERGFYHVEPDEIVEFAGRHGLQTEIISRVTDKLGRKEVTWQTVIVTKRVEG
ncbi:MAG: class I SAM-dependent methyltransferase [Desulfobulbaceae bacterium]|nr:class I SAM-dependent methyltransferase [Desulfobulbaceae bacterium]